MHTTEFKSYEPKVYSFMTTSELTVGLRKHPSPLTEVHAGLTCAPTTQRTHHTAQGLYNTANITTELT